MRDDILSLEAYAGKIGLFDPFLPAEAADSRKEREEIIDRLLNELELRDDAPADRRRFLRGVLNTLEPNTLGEESARLLDRLLQAELKEKELSDAAKLAEETEFSVGGTKVGLFQGDITTLKIDAVVNAANDRLLGCFQPLHSCIDNAIHSAAGVRLRDDCRTIMTLQGFPEPTGTAKITRAYNLPSRYVIHTVGPVVRGPLTGEHEALLEQSYLSCLDLCAALPQIRSIAFCCISTGVFGYPPGPAAETAVRTVARWLRSHPGSLDFVLFNVFTDRDREIYEPVLGGTVNETLLKKAAGMLEQCDGILIGAGSGLSAAAGLNYTDREKFAEIFPAWKRRGFSMQYELVGRRDMTPREMWGYLTVHLNYVYYGQHANPLYMKLREIVGRRDCFVMTSNVDDLFLKSGFDRDRIYTPQGSYGRIQCAAPCSDRTWDLRPRFETLQKALDPVEQVITDEKAIPVCPNCGGPMFLNVRVDSTMSDAPYLPQQERLITWLEGMEDRKLLLLELGAGYNTPVVIRMPMERIAATYREAEMIRVNDRYHQVPDEIRDRSLSVKEDIARFIEGLYQTAGPGRTKLNTGRKLWKRKQ